MMKQNSLEYGDEQQIAWLKLKQAILNKNKKRAQLKLRKWKSQKPRGYSVDYIKHLQRLEHYWNTLNNIENKLMPQNAWRVITL